MITSCSCRWPNEAAADAVIRSGIRRLCRQRVLRHPSTAVRDDSPRHAITGMAEVPELANAFTRCPRPFYDLCLCPPGSTCHWDDASDLDTTESNALNCRPGMRTWDGQDILELGRSWGSFTLWMAQRYPNSRITAISNSHGQRESIERSARERGLHNIEVRTVDVNVLELDTQFDRIVSIEMMEHLRNWPRLLRLMRSWLRPDGAAFVHVFCHRTTPYRFDPTGPGTGCRGVLLGGHPPSLDLLEHRRHGCRGAWEWNGEHYARTSEAWLQRLDANRVEAMEVLAGDPHGTPRFNRWRMPYLACAECFARVPAIGGWWGTTGSGPVRDYLVAVSTRS